MDGLTPHDLDGGPEGANATGGAAVTGGTPNGFIIPSWAIIMVCNARSRCPRCHPRAKSGQARLSNANTAPIHKVACMICVVLVYVGVDVSLRKRRERENARRSTPPATVLTSLGYGWGCPGRKEDAGGRGWLVVSGWRVVAGGKYTNIHPGASASACV
jgi:hypothetical protein